MAVTTNDQQELLNTFFSNPRSFLSLAQDGITVGFDNGILFTKNLKQALDPSRLDFLNRIYKNLNAKYPKLLFDFKKVTTEGTPNVLVKIYIPDESGEKLSIDNDDIIFPIDEFFNQETVNEISSQISKYNATRYDQNVSFIASTGFDSDTNGNNVQTVKGIKIGDDTFSSVSLSNLLNESAFNKIVESIISSIVKISEDRAILFNLDNISITGNAYNIEYIVGQNDALLEGRTKSAIIANYNEFPVSIFHETQALQPEEQEAYTAIEDTDTELAKLTKWYTPEGQEEFKRKNILKSGSMLSVDYITSKLVMELQKLQASKTFTVYYLDASVYSNNDFSMQESQLYPSRVNHTFTLEPSINIASESINEYVNVKQKSSEQFQTIEIPKSDFSVKLNETVKEYIKLVKNNSQDTLKSESSGTLLEFNDVDGLASSLDIVKAVYTMNDTAENLGESRTLKKVNKSISNAENRRKERAGE